MGIPRDVLVAAVQRALLSAAESAVGPTRQLRVDINQRNGDIRAFAKLVVAEQVISAQEQISLVETRRFNAEAQPGDEVEVDVTPAGFGRVASQHAKQALMEEIRRAEQAKRNRE